jgi:hypothetical protein
MTDKTEPSDRDLERLYNDVLVAAQDEPNTYVSENPAQGLVSAWFRARAQNPAGEGGGR